MENNNYKNYGDVSLGHGFILVLQDDENCFRILKTEFEYDNEINPFLLYDLYVDISDDWINWNDIVLYSSTDLNNPIHMAIDATNYYSCENFQCYAPIKFESLELLENALKNDYNVNFETI